MCHMHLSHALAGRSRAFIYKLNYYINFSIACTSCVLFTVSEIMRIKPQLVAVRFIYFDANGVIKTN